MDNSRKAFEEWNPNHPLDSVHRQTYRVNQWKPFDAGWQAAQQHFLKMLESEEMVGEVVKAIEGGAVWFPNNSNSRKSMVKAALSTIKAKLGAA